MHANITSRHEGSLGFRRPKFVGFVRNTARIITSGLSELFLKKDVLSCRKGRLLRRPE